MAVAVGLPIKFLIFVAASHQTRLDTRSKAIKVPTIILDCIFSMLFSEYRACGPISIPTPPIVALKEFFPWRHWDKRPSIASIVIFNIFAMNISGTHIMPMIIYVAGAVSLGSWLILFKVSTLNVTICIMRLHFTNFFSLSSVAYFFFSPGAKVSTCTGCALFCPCEERCGLDKWFECESW